MKRPAVLISALLSVLSLQARGAAPVVPTTGEPRFLAILIEFSDLSFTLEDPAVQTDSLLNYDEFDANGSVKAFYEQNSQGAYSPSFDVVGPVRLQNRVATYGRDIVEGGVRIGDCAPEKALYDACLLLDEEVDFSLYDQDGDGLADNILFFFAGYDQAEGGRSTTLWSHQGNVQDSEDEPLREARFDGVGLGNYIALPELRGNKGRQISGIGVIVHELGHYLGLPDFYDANGTVDGHAGGMYGYSPMGLGMYNNEGRTPPCFTSLELCLLGWISPEDIQDLPEGPVLLPPVRERIFYKSETGTEGEYFLYEYRGGEDWDSPLQKGLLILHVDQSERLIGETPALLLWEDWRNSNAINARADHPCCYAIPSSDRERLAYSAVFTSGDIVFPGLHQQLFYEPVDWEGQFTGVQITNIGLTEEAASFHVLRDAGPNINGRVFGPEGNPLDGVSAFLEGVQGAQMTTDADGFFRLNLPLDNDEKIFNLSAWKDGYRLHTEEVSLDANRMVSIPVTLQPEGHATESPLSKYDRHASMGYFSTMPGLGAVRFTADDLAPYVGQLLSEISFYPYLLPDFSGDIYVTVDFGRERVLTRKLEKPVFGTYFQNSIDISDADIVIPEGVDIYIGYGSPDAGNGQFFVGTVYPAAKGNSFYSPFSLSASTWNEMYLKSAGIYMDVALTATVAEKTTAESLGDMGFHYIDPGQGSYKAGDDFPLVLVESSHAPLSSVSWLVDDEPTRESSIVLKAGQHSVKARLQYKDGRKEVLELILKVN